MIFKILAMLIAVLLGLLAYMIANLAPTMQIAVLVIYAYPVVLAIVLSSVVYLFSER